MGASGTKGRIPASPERLLLLFELGQAFSELTGLEDLLAHVNERTREVLGAESCAILLLDRERNELSFPVSSDVAADVEGRFREIRFPADRGVAGWVVQRGEPAVVHDASADDRFFPEIDRLSGARTRNLLYAPLRTRRGIIGVIGLRNKLAGGFTEEDLAFLDALAGSIAVAIDNARLHAEIRRSAERLETEVSTLKRDMVRRDRFAEIVGESAAMTEVFRLMEAAARSPIPVLIEGETGTGKELVSRAIHRESARAGGPFLAVNCAALPESLLESELFGHRRGAFTGATDDRRGLFEAAARGTLLLDEVGEMAPAMQAKLLRVLEEGEVVPLGDTRPRKVDVRVISATNRDLRSEAETGTFRRDLYYRLAAFPIRLPPLRERPEDVSLLVDHVLRAAAERHQRRITGCDQRARDALLRYAWPGNVRELRNELERAVALAQDGEAIGIEHLSAHLRVPGGTAPEAAAPLPAGAGATLRAGRASFEARYIAEALEHHGGNVTRAAKALGMSRVTLYKKLREHGLR